VRAAALCAPSHQEAATFRINSSARAARCGGARVVALGAIGRARACLGAGVTWTSRTANAPWAARSAHSSVIDAAGAIYVIGGYSGMNFNDVWASTDGGARPDSVQGWLSGGYTGWVLTGYSGCTQGTMVVLRGYKGVV
jgi:hypothetical protein